MKVYVVELWSDIHNYGYEQDEPKVFAEKTKADAYAKELFDKYHKEYEYDLSDIDESDDLHWVTEPNDKDGSWSFNTDKDDRFECDVYEKEIM